MAKSVLIVEDRTALRKLMEHALAQEGYLTFGAASGEEGIEALGKGPIDLVLTDLKLPGVSGMEVLAASRELHPEVPVVVLTAFGTVAAAVEAMKLGAEDFLEKPVELDELSRLVHSLVGQDRAEPFFTAPGAPPIIGRHPTLRAALRLLRKVAPTESTVLLTGESGTGKELFARALHALSKRSEGPFVAVNCAAIPEALMENELFGHEKGAYTGAVSRQAGRFEAAASGTLFLDEIGELQLAVQGKILRALEERTFERVGGGRSLETNVRIVTATNRDLEAMVQMGEFRQDLYFRLEVFPIELPPLRERASDVAALAQHLVASISQRLGQAAPELADDALEMLAKQPWPGNVRQMANVLERAVILAEKPRLRAADLQPLLGSPPVGEKEKVRQALVDADGERLKAADSLGISVRTLQRKIRQHGLEGVPHYRR